MQPDTMQFIWKVETFINVTLTVKQIYNQNVWTLHIVHSDPILYMQ